MTVRTDIEVVWLTTEVAGLPHIRAFIATNPDVRFHVHIGRLAPPGPERVFIWRNNDAFIRRWWRRNRDKVRAGTVVFFEWDVLCNHRLGDNWATDGLAAGRLIEDMAQWHWQRDVAALPDEFRPHARGVAPFAVLAVNRRCLDAIAEPRFDDIYSRDIFCELRTPTVAHVAGFPLRHRPMPGVGIYPIDFPGMPGLWHPVKVGPGVRQNDGGASAHAGIQMEARSPAGAWGQQGD